MSNKTQELIGAIEENLSIFDSEKRIVTTKAGPGTGKTTFLLDTMEQIYGEYITEAIRENGENGDIVYIPAKKGNSGLETKELFNEKTRDGTNVTYLNEKIRTIFLALNTKIVNEIDKKTTQIDLQIGNKDAKKSNKTINVKTSHGLLFKMATHLGLFEGNVTTDYAKGSFTLQDSLVTLKHIPEFVKIKGKNDQFKDITKILTDSKNIYYDLAILFKEVVNSYYESTITFQGEKTYQKLLDIAEENLNAKDNESKTFKERVDGVTGEGTDAIKLVKAYLFAMKDLIKEGVITVGHSYYYKMAYMHCINKEDNLLKLFSKDNNPDLYYNIIFVDEAQDLTPIMINLLARLYDLSRKKNLEVSIAIVGDTKQAIYGFSNMENAFDSLVKKIGEENITAINKYTSYRLPQNVCNFVNKMSKKLFTNYNEQEDLKAFYQEADGYVFPLAVSTKNFAKYSIAKNKQAIVVGRTNAEVVVNYIENYLELKKINPLLVKKLRVNAKVKKEFKNIMTKGIDGLDNENLKDKIKVLAKKDKVSLKDIAKNKELYNAVPDYIQKMAMLSFEYSEEDIKEALSQRSSSKALVEFMTVHASKGLEAENVYILDGIHESIAKIIGTNSTKNPDNLKSAIANIVNPKETLREDKNLKKSNYEEACIMYVAATRAKEVLFLGERIFKQLKYCINNVSININQVINDFENNIIKAEITTSEKKKNTLVKKLF